MSSGTGATNRGGIFSFIAVSATAVLPLVSGCSQKVELLPAVEFSNSNPNDPYIPSDAPYDQIIEDAMSHILPAAASTPRLVYVAPPSGNTLGTGTKADPFRDLISAVRNAQAGDRIYLQPGVYNMSEIRDLWGHATSVLQTGNSGSAGNPIVFSTDPEEFDPGQDRVAVIDFQYDNIWENVRTSCFWMTHDFWILENLEIRRVSGRGIMLQGYDNIIRNNHMHHLNTTGTNNQALIVVIASGRETNNFIVRNHIHHVGPIDEATDTLTSTGGVNGGCIYTETRQIYDSTFPSLVGASSIEEIKAGVLPADSHAYIYGNELNHCHYGASTKTEGEGPYFFIGNRIHDVDVGIRTAYSNSLIRDNIIYGGSFGSSSTGIQIGQSGGSDHYLSALNGVNIEVDHNTVVGFSIGINFYGGWNSRAHHNLTVGETEGLHIHRRQFFWYEAGGYPGIRGEYLLGNLDSNHPYSSTHFANMPSVMYLFGFQRLSSTDNAYSREPVIQSYSSQNNGDIQGQIFDTNHVVISPEEINQLFRDPAANDYRRNTLVYPEYGSRL